MFQIKNVNLLFFQGSPQFIVFDFLRNVQLKEIQIQFQGGFVGCDCQVEGGDSVKSLVPFHQFYPDDVNTLQVSLKICYLLFRVTVFTCCGAL